MESLVPPWQYPTMFWFPETPVSSMLPNPVTSRLAGLLPQPYTPVTENGAVQPTIHAQYYPPLDILQPAHPSNVGQLAAPAQPTDPTQLSSTAQPSSPAPASGTKPGETQPLEADLTSSSGMYSDTQYNSAENDSTKTSSTGNNSTHISIAEYSRTQNSVAKFKDLGCKPKITAEFSQTSAYKVSF